MKSFNVRETPGGPTIRITASSDAKDFMNSPSTSTAITGPSQARSTLRVDRIVDRIWERNSTKKQPQDDNPNEVVFLDNLNSTGKLTKGVILLESTPNEDNDTADTAAREIVEAEPLTKETEEHEGGPPSSISDINPRDFFDPSEFLYQKSFLWVNMLWRNSRRNTKE